MILRCEVCDKKLIGMRILYCVRCLLDANAEVRCCMCGKLDYDKTIESACVECDAKIPAEFRIGSIDQDLPY